MHPTPSITAHANDCIARTLAYAVEQADKPRHQIAREVGMHRETLLRVLRGERPIGLDEPARILGVCGASPRATLVLALSGQEDLACEWMCSEMGEFLEELFSALPAHLERTLGLIARVKPGVTRAEEIRAAVMSAAQARKTRLSVLMLVNPHLMKEARTSGSAFFPWRKRPAKR